MPCHLTPTHFVAFGFYSDHISKSEVNMYERIKVTTSNYVEILQSYKN